MCRTRNNNNRYQVPGSFDTRTVQCATMYERTGLLEQQRATGYERRHAQCATTDVVVQQWSRYHALTESENTRIIHTNKKYYLLLQVLPSHEVFLSTQLHQQTQCPSGFVILEIYNSVVTDCETEEDQKQPPPQKSWVNQVKCLHTGYENTTQERPENTNRRTIRKTKTNSEMKNNQNDARRTEGCY